MPILLQIETSSTNTSVAIAKDGKILASKEQDSAGYSHEKFLHPFIDEVLKLAELQTSDIDAVAVGSGPGSFTGLRIGVSAAKGLCFALEIPLIAIPTMELLARQVQLPADRIIPMTDARRMEVYTATYDHNYNVIEPTTAKIIDEDAYSDLADKKLVFIGSGAQKLKELKSFDDAIFIPDALPSSIEMSIPALERYNAKEWEDTAYFEPFYLKDFKPN